MIVQNLVNKKSDPLPEDLDFRLDLIDGDTFIETDSLEEKVKLLLLKDLFRLNWNIEKSKEKFIVKPPKIYTKQIIKQSMSISRQEILTKNKKWIDNHLDLAKENLAYGEDVLKSKILPRIEVCTSPKQHAIFRIFRYYWSSPYSEYVGRRIRMLVRDDGIDSSPIIGIMAIGSSIIHIPDRDKWIGWNKQERTNNIINIMDAYVLGALPPYNYLLGGKLLSYILTSNEVRSIYKKKYENKQTIIRKRKASDLVCIFTTSLYGRSSQYNRLTFNKKLLYKPIGKTKGYGTLHITNNTFSAMCELVKEHGVEIKNRFGHGPNWRMRVIREAADILGFDADILLNHSFKRGIYAIPLAENFRSVLIEQKEKPIYYNLPLNQLIEYWKKRWLNMRKNNKKAIQNVLEYYPQSFDVSSD